MQALQEKTYFGRHKQETALPFLHLTDTEYTYPRVDWHYHANPYFTYLIAGKLFEANRQEEYYVEPGGLLYHHWQDAHYNRKPASYTQGFHLELDRAWFRQYDCASDQIEGSLHIQDPEIRQLFDQIYLESKTPDQYSQSHIDSLLLRIFDRLASRSTKQYMKRPDWTKKIEDLIRDGNEDQLRLKEIATELQLHPVYLSREFPRYFHCNFGDYIRKTKVQRASTLLKRKQANMSDITYQCGFADQSHFIRTFKRYYRMTPRQYRQTVVSG